MAATGILGQMFFSTTLGRRRVGWSEGHYCITAGNLATALVDIRNLAMLRVQMLGMGVYCDYLRVSDRSVFRDSQVDDGPAPNPVPQAIVTLYNIVEATDIYNPALATGVSAAGAQAGQGLESDFPSSAYLVRVEGGTIYKSRTSIVLRGNPDYAQTINNNSPKGAAWLTAYNQFIGPQAGVSTLLSGKFGFCAQDQALATPGKNVTGVAQVAPFQLTIPGNGFIQGDRIRIRGMRIRSGTPLNGAWTVQNVAGDLVTLYDYVGPTVQLGGSGIAFKISLVPIAYNKAVGRRWTVRKVGNPFDPVHGKAKKKKQTA